MECSAVPTLQGAEGGESSSSSNRKALKERKRISLQKCFSKPLLPVSHSLVPLDEGAGSLCFLSKGLGPETLMQQTHLQHQGRDSESKLKSDAPLSVFPLLHTCKRKAPLPWTRPWVKRAEPTAQGKGDGDREEVEAFARCTVAL